MHETQGIVSFESASYEMFTNSILLFFYIYVNNICQLYLRAVALEYRATNNIN